MKSGMVAAQIMGDEEGRKFVPDNPKMFPEAVLSFPEYFSDEVVGAAWKQYCRKTRGREASDVSETLRQRRPGAYMDLLALNEELEDQFSLDPLIWDLLAPPLCRLSQITRGGKAGRHPLPAWDQLLAHPAHFEQVDYVDYVDYVDPTLFEGCEALPLQ